MNSVNATVTSIVYTHNTVSIYHVDKQAKKIVVNQVCKSITKQNKVVTTIWNRHNM